MDFYANTGHKNLNEAHSETNLGIVIVRQVCEKLTLLCDSFVRSTHHWWQRHVREKLTSLMALTDLWEAHITDGSEKLTSLMALTDMWEAHITDGSEKLTSLMALTDMWGALITDGSEKSVRSTHPWWQWQAMWEAHITDGNDSSVRSSYPWWQRQFCEKLTSLMAETGL